MSVGQSRWGRKLRYLGAAAALGLAMPAAASYVETPEGRAFVDDMVQRYAFDRSTLERWLGLAQQQPAILDAISRPAERTLTWAEYRRIFIKPSRIEKGRAFLDQYADIFARAERELGVSRYVVAAIIGVETQYGEYAGRYRVVDALATLAFDYPPRSSFFRGQLGEFFLMAREQALDPAVIKGSYAGAMGYGQFIPSSYRHYAIDFDGDGQADIIQNPVDAIGSVANYFARHGWRDAEAVAEQVTTADYAPRLYTDGLKPRLTIADYRAAGIEPQAELAAATRARLLRVEAEAGQQDWLTYPNFYVITRYNHSHLYAMAVLELSRALAADDGSVVDQAGTGGDA
ncbi:MULTISPECIES: lytic murein transglycosylase B [Marinobacter]|uniref:lytic murein transglycosylase B n=1 Tax=Marinobacter TaxID=2742 RepID=UPI000DAC9BE3|nr:MULTISPECIES: lytic murein transglycosylase B [Marinobacter]